MSDAALQLPDDGTAADLATFVARAGRVDPGGAARLMARGQVLAAYVSPVHGGGGPTVLGLRVLRLAAPAEVDTTVPLAALADRFARLEGASAVSGAGDPEVAGTIRLALPPMQATGAAWAGMSPPRQGWEVIGTVPDGVLSQAASDGIDEVAAQAPQGAGAQAVSRLRALVWGRDLPGVAGVPAGAAYAADALGFVIPNEPVALYAAGAWRRLSTARGHVLARSARML